jgi:DeoR family transcriptional regulator of aga operon
MTSGVGSEAGVSSGADASPEAFTPERRNRRGRFDAILARLSTEGAVAVAEIAEELNVSSASIRRDLEVLEQRKLLVRTHGGAIATGVTYELPLRYRAGRQEQQKHAIAETAAERVSWDRATVGFTGGTTTTEVARRLVEHPDLTVVTNALNIASEVVVRPNVKLLVTGGVARTQSYELCGPFAEATLGGINIDVAFVGVDGISVRGGLTTYQEIEAHTNAVMLRRASRVIVTADGSKIGRSTFARICGINEVDELITDSSVDPAAVEALVQAGLRVTIADGTQ